MCVKKLRRPSVERLSKCIQCYQLYINYYKNLFLFIFFVDLHVRISDGFDFRSLRVFAQVECFTVTSGSDLEVFTIKLRYFYFLKQKLVKIIYVIDIQ